MASRKQPYLALCLQSALVFLEGICRTSLKRACLGEFCVFAGLPAHTTVCEAAERSHTPECLKTPGDGRTGAFLTDGKSCPGGRHAGCRMSTRGRCGHLIIHHHKYVKLDFFFFSLCSNSGSVHFYDVIVTHTHSNTRCFCILVTPAALALHFYPSVPSSG